MRRILNVIDVSVYMHAGSKGKHSKDKSYYGVPTGGIEMLMRDLSLMEQDLQTVVLAFDSDTDRRGILEEYKQNRVQNKAVAYQNIKMFELLNRAGYKCVRMAGYEADDIINKVVKDNYDKYLKIKVYTADRDLAHLVDSKGKVSLVSPVSIGTDVNKENYKWVIDNDRIVEYNCVLPYKVLYGDKSDNVRPLTFKTKGWTPETALDNFMESVKDKVGPERFSDEIVMKWWLQKIVKGREIVEEDAKEIIRRMKVMYPREIKESLKHEHRSINKEVITEICTMFNLRDVAKHWGLKMKKMDDNMKEEMFKEKSYYDAGMFSIDESICLEVDVLGEGLGRGEAEGVNVKSF